MITKRFKTSSLICGLLLLLFSLGCQIGLNNSDDEINNTDKTAEEPFSYAFKVDSQTRLNLDAINGSIEIIGSTEADSVIVKGIRRVGSESTTDAAEHLEKLKVTTSATSDEIQVKTTQPTSDERNYVVNYEVIIPNNFNVHAENTNGTIVIKNVTAKYTKSRSNALRWSGSSPEVQAVAES